MPFPYKHKKDEDSGYGTVLGGKRTSFVNDNKWWGKLSKKKSAYARQKEGKVFFGTKDSPFSSLKISEIKWDILRNEYSAWKKDSPAQRKQRRDNTIILGKPS